ncbi:MAG: MlaE family lipid ABC transporter permease subunit [Candidatus Cloacimonadaceae bacterium]|jgi:phospholipid/cholesterol/gamma-HCH transport system permease protein|nr:MlaE family lipid ABC transporter permease subunit [Candidatus Cloacimonadota bacterium]MDY0128388.1 MlaE family lipid ABC transporter permease subunit [Candidatus Cloacimonadaceae bacterium]MCB5255029.1 MlaE family lipid ABC transporter permease subunit [Candidatus Cloacimonadota bacterium]MCK9178032.1 MlaE family lipid ABC transporter permease subunit [Candidatus Cloacimonadota bacterium]MCK9241876.1 MlaE family lipid ABC transporter permease subunit [Candidatus Cloacimonadota bacterium]
MELKLSNDVLTFTGELNNLTVPVASKELSRLLKHDSFSTIDLAELTMIDSAGVAFLDEVHHKLAQDPKKYLFDRVPPKIQAVIDTYSTLNLPKADKAPIIGIFEQVGDSVINFVTELIAALTLASEILYYSIVSIFSHKEQRRGSLVQQAAQLGSQALPIVALLSLIIGFILALQSGVQLKNFGASIFIADLLAITMVREMGPLITAIIVAGRSGSAIASEIATMKVTEEIDALKMMALNPISYVVVPKFHAITIVMPILVMASILVSEIGGGIIAIGLLDLAPQTFISRSIDIISIKDIIISFGKSIWFAWVIVIIGSYYGFRVQGGAEGVGKATTSAVVTSIFAVILFDAVFSLLYL